MNEICDVGADIKGLDTGSSYAGGQWAAGDEPLYYIVSPKDVVIAKPRLVTDYLFHTFCVGSVGPNIAG